MFFINFFLTDSILKSAAQPPILASVQGFLVIGGRTAKSKLIGILCLDQAESIAEDGLS
jgi:hypothetical protein